MKILTKSALALFAVSAMSSSAFASSEKEDSKLEDRINTAREGIDALVVQLKTMGIEADAKVDLTHAETDEDIEEAYLDKYEELKDKFSDLK